MYLNTYSRIQLALGGDASVNFVCDFPETKAESLMNEIWRYIYTFERRFSRFLPMSELSVFNRNAGVKQRVSREFLELLAEAKNLSILTDGLYNPFILPALQRAGYINSAVEGYTRDAQENHQNKSVVNPSKLIIKDGFSEIPYNTAIDLGGCGKGYLAEKIGEILKQKGVKGYWISLSGDIATFGIDENKTPIFVDIQDANKLNRTLDTLIKVPKSKYAIATSGTFRRGTQTKDKKWHHIIDPKTLKPTETDILLSTVCAANASLADVLASCSIILGSQKAPKFLAEKGAKAWLLQIKDRSGRIQVIREGGVFIDSKSNRLRDRAYA